MGLTLVALVTSVPHARADPACSGRYTVSADLATVTDNDTHLVWQRKVDAAVYTWQGAKDSCDALSPADGKWRLPHIFELLTIVDDSQTSSPAIDAAAFPQTPLDFYWSASPYAGDASSMWIVQFGVGDNGYASAVSTSYHVRCVR